MKTLATALIATTLALGSSLAFAQHGRGHGHGHDRDDHGWHDRDHGRWDHHHRDRHVERRVVVHRYGPPRYVGHYGHWERGHRYYGPTYIVRDYPTYRLRPPPRGYHWVRADDGQYLLVAIATGIILDIALH